jgi:putative transposase
MASLNSFAVLEWIRKRQDEDHLDVLRELMQRLAQFIVDAEATAKIGAERREPRHATQRFALARVGYAPGNVELKIPKLRQGRFFPSLLEPRRRAAQALAAVIQEADVKGVRTRKVDDLVRALGLEGISPSELSRLCPQRDETGQQFKERPLDHE